MGYAATIIKEDGSEVAITARAKKFKIADMDGTLHACIGWCKEELKNHPRQYLAVAEAWPGRETLELTGEDSEEPVFTGLVSAAGYKEGVLFLKATSDGGPGPDPLELDISEDTSDPTRLTASILVDNKGEGEVSIDFGDGSPTETNPGDGTTPTVHAYAAAGTYVLAATDTDQPERTASENVTVPFSMPGDELEVTVDPNSEQMTVSVLADNKGHGEVSIDFGDGSPTETNPGDGTTASSHTYMTAGTYMLTVTDTDQPERTYSQDVVVPFAA